MLRTVLQTDSLIIFQTRSTSRRGTYQITAHDDPDGAARRIAARWTVNEPVTTLRLRPSGEIERCSHLLFNVGDFVEVAITFEVSSMPKRGPYSRERTESYLKLQQIVQLKEANQVKVCFAPSM